MAYQPQPTPIQANVYAEDIAAMKRAHTAAFTQLVIEELNRAIAQAKHRGSKWVTLMVATGLDVNMGTVADIVRSKGLPNGFVYLRPYVWADEQKAIQDAAPGFKMTAHQYSSINLYELSV